MAIGTEEERLPMMSADTDRQINNSHVGYANAQYETARKLIDDIVTSQPNVKEIEIILFVMMNMPKDEKPILVHFFIGGNRLLVDKLSENCNHKCL